MPYIALRTHANSSAFPLHRWAWLVRTPLPSPKRARTTCFAATKPMLCAKGDSSHPYLFVTYVGDLTNKPRPCLLYPSGERATSSKFVINANKNDSIIGFYLQCFGVEIIRGTANNQMRENLKGETEEVDTGIRHCDSWN